MQEKFADKKIILQFCHMKYKVINPKPTEGAFIRVPQNIDFKLKPTPFKVLVWLMQHKDGFEMNEYFIKQGIGMDYRTFRKNLEILQKEGTLKFSIDTISTITISYDTKNIVVNLLTNKNKKQEERKPEKKPEEKKQEEVSSSGKTLKQDTANSVLVSDFQDLVED